EFVDPAVQGIAGYAQFPGDLRHRLPLFLNHFYGLDFELFIVFLTHLRTPRFCLVYCRILDSRCPLISLASPECCSVNTTLQAGMDRTPERYSVNTTLQARFECTPERCSVNTTLQSCMDRTPERC